MGNSDIERLQREVASYRAITRRLDDYTRRAEEALQQFRAQIDILQALIDVLPDPLLLVDRTGRIHRANPAAVALFSLPAAGDELPLCSSVIPCDSCLRTRCAVCGQAGEERQVQRTAQDGTARTYLVATLPLPDDHCVLLFRDITPLAVHIAQLAEENWVLGDALKHRGA